MKANKRHVMGRLGPIAAAGALAAGAVGALGLAAGPAGAATAPDCSGQLSGSNNLCVDGSGGTLTVTPSGSLGAAPLVINGVANAFLGSISTSGATSFPASGTSWIGGLQGTLAGITAQITISNSGTATGSYDPSTNTVSLAGNLSIHLVAPPGPCTYSQPFNVSGTLTSFSQSGSVYKATGSVTQPSVAVAINSGTATGAGCGIAKSVLTGATQTLTLPVTIYTTLDPHSITAAPSGSTTPSTTTPGNTSTGSSPSATGSTGASGGSASTVPSANTGEPWSGWIWWAAIAAIGTAGIGLMLLGGLRRRGAGQRA